MSRWVPHVLTISRTLFFLTCMTAFGVCQDRRIQLNEATILVDSGEPSYVQYGAHDLASYISEITGTTIPVVSSVRDISNSKKVLSIGAASAGALDVPLSLPEGTSSERFAIRSFTRKNATIVAIGGPDPHGTNAAIATLLQMIKSQNKSAYLDDANMESAPRFQLRGIHLNGWPLNYPYAFRSWKEADWKRFVDIAWAQRINLFYLWPFMEILPVPLSAEDEAYLQEVRRVVEYAQTQRGMQVWIMQSANRIGVSDCKTRDPRFRPYWVNECQKDMNPADSAQFTRIMKSFEALYQIVNNADAFVMIDSDPGGWPQSPLSDQARIFQGARKLLDQYSVHKDKTPLVDWMHVGWGRHKFFTSTDSVVAAYDWTDKNPDESDVAFMGETIRNFKENLAEPWGLIAGQPPYLPIVQQEGVLDKTVYLPYGAIESEPAFPSTNLGQETVRKVFDRAGQFPGLEGVMGNNQLMLLQFPRTYYFFATAWDPRYEDRPEADVMMDLAAQLYPAQKQLIASAFLALREDDPQQIGPVLTRLKEMLAAPSMVRAGALGRFLFPDALSVARNLTMQLEIRSARQTLIKALRAKPDIQECARLLENYFDKLLAWNKETGWDKMIDITVWPRPIYGSGKDLTHAIYRLKQILAQGAPYTSYSKVNAFFAPISTHLLQKYGEDSVMVGCVDPFKLAVIQSQ